MVQLPLTLPEPQRPQIERFVDSILASTVELRISEVADNAPEVVSARKKIRRAETTDSLEGIPGAMAVVRSRAEASAEEA